LAEQHQRDQENKKKLAEQAELALKNNPRLEVTLNTSNPDGWDFTDNLTALSGGVKIGDVTDSEGRILSSDSSSCKVSINRESPSIYRLEMEFKGYKSANNLKIKDSQIPGWQKFDTSWVWDDVLKIYKLQGNQTIQLVREMASVKIVPDENGCDYSYIVPKWDPVLNQFIKLKGELKPIPITDGTGSILNPLPTGNYSIIFSGNALGKASTVSANSTTVTIKPFVSDPIRVIAYKPNVINLPPSLSGTYWGNIGSTQITKDGPHAGIFEVIEISPKLASLSIRQDTLEKRSSFKPEDVGLPTISKRWTLGMGVSDVVLDASPVGTKLVFNWFFNAIKTKITLTLPKQGKSILDAQYDPLIPTDVMEKKAMFRDYKDSQNKQLNAANEDFKVLADQKKSESQLYGKDELRRWNDIGGRTNPNKWREREITPDPKYPPLTETEEGYIEFLRRYKTLVVDKMEPLDHIFTLYRINNQGADRLITYDKDEKHWGVKQETTTDVMPAN